MSSTCRPRQTCIRSDQACMWPAAAATVPPLLLARVLDAPWCCTDMCRSTRRVEHRGKLHSAAFARAGTPPCACTHCTYSFSLDSQGLRALHKGRQRAAEGTSLEQPLCSPSDLAACHIARGGDSRCAAAPLPQGRRAEPPNALAAQWSGLKTIASSPTAIFSLRCDGRRIAAACRRSPPTAAGSPHCAGPPP